MAAAKGVALSNQQVMAIARALADPRRYEILQRIGANGVGMQCGAMRGCVGVSAATLSHHMKELEMVGLVASTRDGKYVTYTLCRDVLRAYLDHMAKI